MAISALASEILANASGLQCEVLIVGGGGGRGGQSSGQGVVYIRYVIDQ